MSKRAQSKDPTYAEAAEELATILGEIEGGAADVDVLSAKVERAATLIRLCRDKIQGAELKVQKVLDDLDADEDGETEQAEG
ncbi:MAG: exodeoxyribonuclease VII small subunit [Planctomycetota bacterium]